MTSGRQALHRLDASIAEARNTLSRASNSAAVDARALAEIDKSQVEIFMRLAEMRLDLIREDDTGASLGAADREAGRLIGKHDGVVTTLAAERDDAEAEIEKLERERRGQEEALENAITAHDEAAETTRDRLTEDTQYQKLATTVEDADSIAKRAAQKLEVARETRAEKGAPYEKDPLFSYLWKRKFATRDYRAFPLFAMLDRWVAGLIRYRDAQLNYRRLLELPERLGEHADRINEAAETAANALEAFEREALTADGVGALRDSADQARETLEALDIKLTTAEKHHEQLAAQHADAVAGKSGPLEEARVLIAKTLSKRPIPDLKILASETIDRHDDQLVDELVGLRRERLELEDSRSAVKRALTRHKQTLSDLENIRRKFKRARYDSPYSEFSGGDLVGALVTELLRGGLGADDVWRKLRRAQRTRRRDWGDDFGGGEWRGGFGLPDHRRSGGNWGGSTRRPQPPIRIPRAPRAPRVRFPRTRGGGGFKTGGGF